MPKENILYYGDNLQILRVYIKDESVDLIYLDPPFKSDRDYNVLFAEQDGSRSESQIKVFEDTWHWDSLAARTYEETVLAGGDVSNAMQAFRTFLGENDMMAYLSMMAPRLVELRRVLKNTGTLYLHCDQTASHYIKILLDSVFKHENFRNEIIWCYSGGGIPTKDFPRKHDTIFRYTKSGEYIYNREYKPYKENTRQVGKHSTYAKGDIEIDLDRGTSVTDWWTDIKTVTGWSPEKIGYPTQKPESLLTRIIETSSNEGDMVLDPFCGCGTTVASAQCLNRRYIGIDITHLAITLIKHRLMDGYGKDDMPRVIGEPTALSGAEILAKDDPYQFQWWALGRVGARPSPSEQKKGADRGIDGRLYFFEDTDRKAKPRQIIFSAKGGGVTVSQVRDLRGVVEREKAAMGVFITLKEPTRNMQTEAANSGFYTPSGLDGEMYQKIQIITIVELLGGKEIACPPYVYQGGNATFKKAQKVGTGKEKDIGQQVL